MYRFILSATVFFVFGACSIVSSRGYEEDPVPQAHPDFVKGQHALEEQNFPAAIRYLELASDRDSNNPDVFNLLGYSYRKQTPPQFQKSLLAYKKALKLDPDHRQANEYLGELYLMMRDLPRAEQRLKVLDKACPFGCDEYTELKKAIKRYKKRGEKNAE